MEQMKGYALLKMPSLLLSHYENWFNQEHIQILQDLRNSVSFVDPFRYRGISRKILSPFPSLDVGIIKEFEETGGDMQSNKQARWRFRELIGENIPYDEDYDEDLLPNLRGAKEVYSLLDDPEGYEIVVMAREPLEANIESLGFDIGYWGGDHFSLICDSIVMPTWHPPDPSDFGELAEKLQGLNEHVLFETRAEAEAFRSYYMTKVWAETETVAGEFQIIQLGLPVI
ncbi:MAG: hypothetical protein U0401_18995 [Anaerolineae bacterium]